ncbi:extracellular calcium-sensing receptor-like [Solea senegalensis]|uniref:Extracellular calcium-sensing receptor-like n=1 Tax=Solea senegalensis TaxID=28829 RepID=A0AAV6SSG0_SOLSE|nr:extracellular calcium-sensing receptor-like [Solea senegalensis]
MRLAVEEINQNPVLLQNRTLGYKIFDSCGYPLTGQRAVLSMLNGVSEENSSMCTNCSSLLAMIGAAGSSQSIVVSRILQTFRIPMISYASSCACLSDRQKYPTFFRVVPSDDYQMKAIAQLLVHFNWTWVGLLRGDHDYGRSAAQGLVRELQDTKVCVAYQEMIPLLYTRQAGLRIMKPGRGPFQNNSCAQSNNIQPWQLQHYLQEVNFQIAGEEVAFDAKGDSVPYYDIINWQRGTEGNIAFVNVGLFDGTKSVGEELLIQEDRIMWAGHQSEVPVSVCSASCLPGTRKAIRHGEPICCFDCVPCDSGKISNQTRSAFNLSLYPLSALVIFAFSEQNKKDEDILAAIHALWKDFSAQLQEVITSNHGIREALDSFSERLSGAESRISSAEDHLNILDIVSASTQRRMLALAKSVETMENRQRRLNLRPVGLPENTEKGDLVSFLNDWLPVLLGSENFPIPPSIDQAFRLPKATTSNDNKPNRKPVPRAILVKFRWMTDKGRVMKAARKEKSLQFEENRVMFFQTFRRRFSSRGESLMM